MVIYVFLKCIIMKIKSAKMWQTKYFLRRTGAGRKSKHLDRSFDNNIEKYDLSTVFTLVISIYWVAYEQSIRIFTLLGWEKWISRYFQRFLFDMTGIGDYDQVATYPNRNDFVFFWLLFDIGFLAGLGYFRVGNIIDYPRWGHSYKSHHSWQLDLCFACCTRQEWPRRDCIDFVED